MTINSNVRPSSTIKKIYKNGRLYTEICADGRQFWYNNKGQLHRDGDAPAIIWADGTKSWFKNGEQHRENGPAIIWSTGREEWYINGKRLK